MNKVSLISAVLLTALSLAIAITCSFFEYNLIPSQTTYTGIMDTLKMIGILPAILAVTGALSSTILNAYGVITQQTVEGMLCGLLPTAAIILIVTTGVLATSPYFF